MTDGPTQPANGGALANGDGGETAGQPRPGIACLAQYVRDLSFENPGAPMSLARLSEQPQVSVNIATEARPLGPDTYEVILSITASAGTKEAASDAAAAKGEEKFVFIAEIQYAGVFALSAVPEAARRETLLIEGPRLLFPFARQIIAEATRDGGFPPLLINPIDFAALYRDSLKRSPGAGVAAGNA